MQTAPALRFHHLGVATKSLAAELRAYQLVGYDPDGEVFTDPRQGIRGQFLAGGGPRLELLEPLPGSHTLTPFLTRGIKLYHHAYEVASMAGSLAAFGAARVKLISAPAPAVAFGGRPIAFLMLPNRWMIELIEAAPGDGP